MSFAHVPFCIVNGRGNTAVPAGAGGGGGVSFSSARQNVGESLWWFDPSSGTVMHDRTRQYLALPQGQNLDGNSAAAAASRELGATRVGSGYGATNCTDASYERQVRVQSFPGVDRFTLNFSYGVIEAYVGPVHYVLNVNPNNLLAFCRTNTSSAPSAARIVRGVYQCGNGCSLTFTPLLGQTVYSEKQQCTEACSYNPPSPYHPFYPYPPAPRPYPQQQSYRCDCASRSCVLDPYGGIYANKLACESTCYPGGAACPTPSPYVPPPQPYVPPPTPAPAPSGGGADGFVDNLSQGQATALAFGAGALVLGLIYGLYRSTRTTPARGDYAVVQQARAASAAPPQPAARPSSSAAAAFGL